MRGLSWAILGVVVAPTPAVCRQDQSILAPHSSSADSITHLANLLITGGGIVLIIVLAITCIAIVGPTRIRRYLADEKSIVLGGIVFPIATLTPLLLYGYAELGRPPERGGESGLHVTVVGERWWWRLIYTHPDGRTFESANELRIPVGRPVHLKLRTADVIHSFWVPNLAGKVDMIPGRTNKLTLSANQVGAFRGQCAEYCGGAHALMAFKVIALGDADFRNWMERESGPAREPSTQELRKGRELFETNGCGGCHTIRGTKANGRVGPDLTHLASRTTLAAARLENTPDNLVLWIRDNQTIKPENLMVPYRNLRSEQVESIASYLESLH